MSSILHTNMKSLLNQITKLLNEENKDKIFALQYLFNDINIGKIYFSIPIRSDITDIELCLEYELFDTFTMSICIGKEELNTYPSTYSDKIVIYIGISNDSETGITNSEMYIDKFLYNLYNNKEELNRRIEKCLFELL